MEGVASGNPAPGVAGPRGVVGLFPDPLQENRRLSSTSTWTRKRMLVILMSALIEEN